jgi:hypothetical protein
MGTSIDGQICFGYAFEEGYEFPWDVTEQELTQWWLDVNGFKHSFEIYDERGNWLGGIKPEEIKITKYYEESRDWLDKHPLPVELVNYCSEGYPMYILAVPSSVIECSWGIPHEFIPEALKVTEEEKEALRVFCEKYNLEPEKEMKWYLSSYRG